MENIEVDSAVLEIPVKWTVRRILWFIFGMTNLGMAYVGLVTPGIPFSTFLTISAFCFAKSSKKWHNYLFNHKKFGPFLKNWAKYRVFPKYAKISMIITMCSSLAFTYLVSGNVKVTLWCAFGMIVCAVWGLRYPSTRQEYHRRVDAGEKVAWIK
jgi:uncharacterized membrane protein YbaN (DUF454 family)